MLKTHLTSDNRSNWLFAKNVHTKQKHKQLVPKGP